MAAGHRSTSRGKKDWSVADMQPSSQAGQQEVTPHLQQASPPAVWRAPRRAGPTQPAPVDADRHPAVAEIYAEMGLGHPAQPLTACAGWALASSALQACSILSSVAQAALQCTCSSCWYRQPGRFGSPLCTASPHYVLDRAAVLRQQHAVRAELGRRHASASI